MFSSRRARLAFVLLLALSSQFIPAFAASSVVAHVPVGMFPSKLLVDDAQDIAYVTSGSTREVSVLHGPTRTVVRTIPTVSSTIGIALHNASGRLFIPNSWDRILQIIDATERRIDLTAHVGEGRLAQAAVNQTTGIAYLTAYRPNKVISVDGSGAVLRVGSLPAEPGAIGVDPLTGMLYVTHRTSISVVDPATLNVTSTIDFPIDPIQLGLDSIAFHPSKHRMYVAANQQGLWLVDLDTNSLVKRTIVDGYLTGVAFDSLRGVLWASAEWFYDRVYSFDEDIRPLTQVITDSAGNQNLRDVGVDASSGTVFAVDNGSGNGGQGSVVLVEPTSGSDSIPPNTTIIQKPSPSTQSLESGFSFDGLDDTTPAPGLAFECSWDSGVFEPCPTPTARTHQPGVHRLDVRAVDAAGNVDPSPATYSWIIDIEPPKTTWITTPPSLSNANNSRFAFSGSDNATPAAAMRFECAIDANAFRSCGSPSDVRTTPSGEHTYRVRAVDAAGNFDASPTEYTWFIDSRAPSTSLTASPSTPSNETDPRFEFTGADDVTPFSDLRYECALDAAAFAACSSPTTLSDVADGTHTFRVRAVDLAGNRDSSAASFEFVVDTQAPTAELDARRSPLVVKGEVIKGIAFDMLSGIASVIVTFEDVVTAEKTLVTGTCLSECVLGRSIRWQAQADASSGIYRVTVSAIDRAGNKGQESDSALWVLAGV